MNIVTIKYNNILTMIRPLLTALLEYALFVIVLKYGSSHKKVIAAILFFLASYQLGEVLVFLSNGDQNAFKVAYISTTLLPPLGVLLVQKIIKKQLGYVLFQLIALVFVALMLINPQIALQFEFGQFCIRIMEYNPVIFEYWFLYYQGTLLFTVLALLIGLMLVHKKEIRYQLKWVLIAYLLFDGGALLIAFINPWFWPAGASLMCALAVFAALILTKMSLAKSFHQ